MKRIGFFVLLCVLITAGTSCDPLKRIRTDVLEPAEIAFPEDVFSVGYLIDEPRIIVNTRANREPGMDAQQQFWTGLMDAAMTSPRFNPRSLKLIETTNDTVPSDTLEWARVKHLTDSLDLDALAVMHLFVLSDSLERQLMYEFATTTFYFIYEVNAKVLWRIYHPAERDVFSEYTYEEEFIWESASEEEHQAIRNLVDLDRAYRSSAYWSGNDIGHLMFPYWEETESIYYGKGSRNFRKASDHVEQNQWEKAIELWTNSFRSTNKELARRAAFNIAFACEMLGKIDLAIEWLQRAQDIQYNRRASEYLETLQERKEKLEKLDQQMPI